MSDDTTDPSELTDASEVTSVTPVLSTYKILGQFDANKGAAVLGQNDADSGRPIGVRGAVPNNSSGYGLYTDGNAFVGNALDVGTVSFEDSASDGNAFTVTESDGTGTLAISNGGTATHEFGTSGRLRIRDEIVENVSL